MKQDVRTDTANTGESVKVTQPRKSQKNLYEPYSTPRILWEVIRSICLLVFFVTARVKLRGRYNIPRRGPYIIAANHLSWIDVPMVPSYIPGKVVYMAKEESFHSKVGWLVRFWEHFRSGVVRRIVKLYGQLMTC